MAGTNPVYNPSTGKIGFPNNGAIPTVVIDPNKYNQPTTLSPLPNSPTPVALPTSNPVPTQNGNSLVSIPDPSGITQQGAAIIGGTLSALGALGIAGGLGILGSGAALAGLGASLIFPDGAGDPKADKKAKDLGRKPTTPPAATPDTLGKPPFKGGQGENVGYYVTIQVSTVRGKDVNTAAYNGKIGGISRITRDGYYVWRLKVGVGTVNERTIELLYVPIFQYNDDPNYRFEVSITKIERIDGAPDGGGDPLPSGGKPNEVGNFIPSLPPYYKPEGLPKLSPSNSPNPSQSPSPSGSPSKPADQSDTTKKPSATPNTKGKDKADKKAVPDVPKPANPSNNPKPANDNITIKGFKDPQVTPTPLPETVPKPAQDPKTIPRPITPPLPDKPTQPTKDPEIQKIKENQDDILRKLGLIPAAILAALTLDQVFNAKQKANAREAVCDASKPNQCVDNAVKRNTDNVNENVNAGNRARDINDAAQSGALASLLAQLASFRTWVEAAFNNTIVDKAINLLNLITNLHNAAMLSTSIKDTLAEAISLGLAAVGIKNPEGSPIDINGALNKSTEALLTSVLGAAQYTALKESWAKANRIIQSGAAVINTARSLYDSTRSLNELTANHVGIIGNALKKDGVVSENAYKVMSTNVSQVNAKMEALQNLENTVSTLASITSEAYSIRENVEELTKQRADFEKNVKDLEPKTQIENVPLKAKETAEKTVSVSPVIPLTELYKPDI